MGDRTSSLEALASVRPPAADLTDEVVDEVERHEILQRILDGHEPLPARLAHTVTPPLRPVVPLTAVAAALVIVVGAVIVTSGPSTDRSTSMPPTPDLATVGFVQEQTAAALAAAEGLQLNLDVSVQDAAGDRAGSVRMVQAPAAPVSAGRATRVDEFDATGAPLSSTLMTEHDRAVTNRTVDHSERTWSEITLDVPDAGSSGERGVIWAAGPTSIVGVGWVGSPGAVTSLLSNPAMQVDEEGPLLRLSGDLSGLASGGPSLAATAALMSGATVELWVDADTYLPVRMRVRSADGTSSDAAVSWSQPAAVNLPVPDGYARR